MIPINDIYQMRPDFDHVNQEATDRIVGGDGLLSKQIQKPVKTSMKIVNDSFKEKQLKEMELENEEEQELKVFNKDSEQAQEVISMMTSGA